MRKSLIFSILALLLLLNSAFARITEVDVTKENQKEQELSFSLYILKMAKDNYQVRLDVSKEGKLEKFTGAGLTIDEDKGTALSVPIREIPSASDRNSAYVFSLNGELLNKATVHLICQRDMAATSYNIQLSTYLPPPMVK